MIVACIDIGSNTTRLLVAEGEGRGLRELASRRSFTRIGRGLAERGRIPEEKIRETATVALAQAAIARELGAVEIAAVATAAIRDAPNRAELAARVEDAVSAPLWILSPEEEARLSFAGATRTLDEPPRGRVAVFDVGGGSTELAVGRAGGRVEWCRSFRIGSGSVADSYLRSDPPAPSELETARAHVGSVLEGLELPRVELATAVGGTATSLRRLVGQELSREALRQGIELVCGAPAGAVAARFGLDPERVPLLPAGMLVLEPMLELAGSPVLVANGGLREGVLLELLDRQAA